MNLTQVSVTAAATGLTASAQSAAQRVDSAFSALDGDTTLQGSAFGTAAGALQWTGGGSKGLEASLQSLSDRRAWAESATFDSIDMSRRAIAERFDRVQAAPRLRGAWQSALGEAGRAVSPAMPPTAVVGWPVVTCRWAAMG